MGIEENRDLNNKKTSEDQLTFFCQFFFGITLREEKRTKNIRKESNQRKDKERKGRKRKVKESKDQARKGWINQLQWE